jgi:molecular chaperone GrpE
MSNKDQHYDVNAAHADEKFEGQSHGEHVSASDSSRAFDEALNQELEQSSGSESATNGGSVDQRLLEAEREVLRARADLENFRKRMQRDAEQQLRYANVPLVRDLIEVVDNLQRAMDAAKQDATHATALRDGVGMVLSQLDLVLSKYGCKKIESVGREFDPNIHEAIAQMPSPEHAAGQVSQEVAAGYTLHDRVVRPSSVIVSTGPQA